MKSKKLFSFERYTPKLVDDCNVTMTMKTKVNILFEANTVLLMISDVGKNTANFSIRLAISRKLMAKNYSYIKFLTKSNNIYHISSFAFVAFKISTLD